MPTLRGGNVIAIAFALLMAGASQSAWAQGQAMAPATSAAPAASSADKDKPGEGRDGGKKAAEPADAWKKIEQQLKERAEKRKADMAAANSALGGDKVTSIGKPAPPKDPSSTAGPAGKPTAQWLDIEKRLKSPRRPTAVPVKPKADKPPTLAEQVNKFGQQIAVQKFADGAINGVGLRFVDLRTGAAPLASGNPFAFAFFTGRGFETGLLKLEGDRAPGLSFSHADAATLSLMASRNELNASIERQSINEAKIQAPLRGDGELTVSVTHLRIERSSIGPSNSYGFAGSYGLSGLGFGTENGITETVILGLQGKFFDQALSIESYIAQSRFWAANVGSAAMPNAWRTTLDDVPRSGFGQMHKFQARLLNGSETKLTLSGSVLITDRDFRSPSYEAGPDTRDFSLAARGQWDWLRFDVSQRWRYDGSFNTDSANLNGGLSANFDNLRITARHNQQRNSSSYAYLTYDYLPTGGSGEPTYDWLPVLQKVSNSSVIATDSANFSWSDSEKLWGLQFSGRQSKGAYRYGENGGSSSLSRTLSLSGSREFGSFGLQLSGQQSLQRRDSSYSEQTLRNELSLTFALALDGNKPEYGSHSIGRSSSQAYRYSFLGPNGVPYAVGTPGAIGAPGVGGAAGNSGDPAKAGEQGKDTALDWLAILAPSSIRASVVRGRTDYRNSSGGDYFGYWGSTLAAGPYWAMEFGANWQGKGGQTDVSIRYTANAGDRHVGVASSAGYDVLLTHSLALGSWQASANFNLSLSDYGPGASMTRQMNASAYVTVGYRTPLLSLDGRVYGTWASTQYSDPAYSSAPAAYLTAELTGEFVLDEWMPVRQARDQAPPYLRLRGFASYQYPATSYAGLAPLNYGVLLVAGTHW